MSLEMSYPVHHTSRVGKGGEHQNFIKISGEKVMKKKVVKILSIDDGSVKVIFPRCC